VSHTTRYRFSPEDRRFREAFEAGRVAPGELDHRAHVRLAYSYLAEYDDQAALALFRAALLAFLGHHGIDPSKYHETITRAWLLAVRHFMEASSGSTSADEFIEAHPILLDTGILLRHYSASLLHSAGARAGFVAPDLEPIPNHEGSLPGSQGGAPHPPDA
jgi:hypothetical protein